MKTTKRAVAQNPRTSTGRLNKLIAELGGLSRSHNDVRRCSRCNDKLSDPSSWERGQGPICAKKDTALYAKTIQANFPMATAHALAVKDEGLHTTVAPVWNTLKDVLFEKSERAVSSSSNGTFSFTFSGEDCRLIAKVIDWMLSFPTRPVEKNHLIQIVKHLGFIGLAGVLSGLSSTGEAELKMENGKLCLTGSSNKAGYLAMRKIPGIVVPRYRGRGAYEAPATQHEPFIAAVMEFWPCFSGEVDNIVEQCKAWIAANPVAAKAQVASPNKLMARVNTFNDTHFALTFAWDKVQTPRLVNELKTIPYKDREYNPATKTWIIKVEHKDRVVKLFSDAYTVLQTNIEDPFFAPKSSAPKRSRYGYFRGSRRY